jgi:hypothetical protein
MSEAKNTAEAVETPIPAPEAAPAETQPELTIQDLTALKNIIDVASQRGAFRPNEMMTVGQTYNKLELFLNAIAERNKGEPK